MRKKIIIIALCSILFLAFPFFNQALAACRTSSKKGAGGEANNTWLNQLGVSWWYNWQWWDNRNFATEAEFVPLVNAGAPFFNRATDQVIGQDIIKVGVAQRRGSFWLVGNEPDRAGQDAIYDSVATARIYKKLTEAIKNEDSTAKIIVGGLAQPENNNNFATSIKNNWPNFCAEISGWHFHHYASSSQYNNLSSWLNETNQFVNHLNSLCPGKQIWLTEIGNFQESNEQNLINWVNTLIPALEGANNIHRYAWYEIKDKPAQHPNMPGLIKNGSLTSLGQAFRQLGNNPCGGTTLTPTPSPTPGPTTSPSPTTTVFPTATPTFSPSSPFPTPASLLEAENFEIIKTPKQATFVIFKKNSAAPLNRGFIQTSFTVSQDGEYSIIPRVNYPSSSHINSLYYRIVKGESNNVKYGVDSVFGNGSIWDSWGWEDAEHLIKNTGLNQNQKYQMHISFRDEGNPEGEGPKLDKIKLERLGSFNTERIGILARLFPWHIEFPPLSVAEATVNRFYLAASRFQTIKTEVKNFPRCTSGLQSGCTFEGKGVFFQRGKFIQTSFISPATGNFYIWLRPKHTTGWANSFYLTLNQEGPEYSSLPAPRIIGNGGPYGGWFWSESNIFAVNLLANKLYTLTIYFREEGTENGPYLDLICFTPDKTFPPNTLPSHILPNAEVTLSPTSTPSPVPCPSGTLGNLNCDSQSLINEIDLAILLGKWNPAGPVPTPDPNQRSADLDNNGKVDEVDLSLLLTNWKTSI